MALTYKDINIENNLIKINKSVKYVWIGEYYPKTKKKIYDYRLTIPKTKKSTREVPLPSMLIPILKSVIKTNKENKFKPTYIIIA